MKCSRAKIYLSPYLDSELDPTTTYRVACHLEACDACARIFAAEEDLERAIGARLRRPRGDEERVLEQALARTFARGARRSGRRAFAAVSVLLLLALLFHRAFSGGGDGVPGLLAMTAKDHQRYLVGEVAPELFTKDPADLAPFFAGELAGELCAFPAGDGWELEGARVCRFEGVPVGLVTLRYHGIPVSVAEVPDADGERVAVPDPRERDDRCFELPGGRGILRRTPCGLRAAFGDIEMKKLEELVLAAAPDHGPQDSFR